MLYAKFTATEISPEAMNRVIIGKCLIFLNFISFISFMYKTIPAHTYIGVAKNSRQHLSHKQNRKTADKVMKIL